MKKLVFTALLVGACFTGKAQTKEPVKVDEKVWTVTSTCATISQIKTPQNVTLQELKKKVQDENVLKCGVRPKSVKVTLSAK